MIYLPILFRVASRVKLICTKPKQRTTKHSLCTQFLGYPSSTVVCISANHLGWFEFRICPNKNIKEDATHECLDRYLLPLADGSGTRLPVTKSMNHINVKLRLPSSLTCSQCVFQWKYNTGKSLQWRHNDHDGVSNHQPGGCFLNRLFRRRSKKTSTLRITGLCAGNSPGPVNSPHKGPVTRKMFPFDDVIMYHHLHRTLS